MPTIHHLEPRIFHTTFGRNEPSLRVASGDTIVAETRDARGNDKHGAPLPDSMRPPADGFEYSTSNPLVGPGTKTLDLSASKDFRMPFSEAHRLTFRTELFNITNTPIMNPPGTTVNGANFGVITGQANGPRNVQLALKVIF